MATLEAIPRIRTWWRVARFNKKKAAILITLSNDLVRFVVGTDRCVQTLGPVDRPECPPRAIATFRHATFFNVPDMMIVNDAPENQEVIVVGGAVHRYRFADGSYERVLDKLPEPWQAGDGVTMCMGGR